MNSELQEKIRKEIETNVNHIDNFPLETNDGTKRMKEKFHKNAVKERNLYIEKETPKFKEYQRQVFEQLDSYKKSIFPVDKKEEYEQENKNMLELLRIVPFTKKEVALEIKLEIAHIFYQLSKETESSLDVINNSIVEFLNIFQKAGITLTLEDFTYSPFVNTYMKALIENKDSDNFDDVMQDTFKEVYWECPELIMHIKHNLKSIVTKYYQKLSEYSLTLEKELLDSVSLTKENIEASYQEREHNLEDRMDKDEFTNLQKFLGKSRNIDDYTIGAPLRSKSFNQLVMKDTYGELTEEEQKDFDMETINLNRDLVVLKEYYNYESIIKDMISRFKKKEESKTKYETKQKEVLAEEKNREKLYKEYIRATGIGFLARPNPTKITTLKTKIKEQINKLDALYKELDELEIDVNISKYLTEGSSVYDFLVTSLSSYYYIEKTLVEKFQDIDVDFNLRNYVRRYMKFVFNPNVEFLHKITATLDYDIAKVVSEKYALLGINITQEEIGPDTIDTAITTVEIVALINNIKNSNMSIEEMKLICDIDKIDYTPEEIL